MELLLNNNLNNNLDLSEKIGELQNKFLKINWGEAINNAVDSGLKIILPDFIENEIIDIKNAFIKGGLKEGIQTAIDITINKGKEIIGIFTGNLENISQAEAIIKNGGLIKNVAKILESIVDKLVKNDLLKEGIGNLIKSGKDTILNYAEKNIDKVNKEQIKKITEIETAIENWGKYYKEQNFTKMQNEYKKIENRMEKIMPIQEIIQKAKEVENLHNLIKNNGNNFNLSEEEIELAKKLI